jgi:hypothetical protein
MSACVECGEVFGFFSSKREVQVMNLRLTVCKSCAQLLGGGGGRLRGFPFEVTPEAQPGGATIG